METHVPQTRFSTCYLLVQLHNQLFEEKKQTPHRHSKICSKLPEFLLFIAINLVICSSQQDFFLTLTRVAKPRTNFTMKFEKALMRLRPKFTLWINKIKEQTVLMKQKQKCKGRLTHAQNTLSSIGCSTMRFSCRGYLLRQAFI